MSIYTASAPGKVILFGEHAVVYGKPAIAMAIDKRVYVSTEVSDHTVRYTNEYINQTIESVFKKIGKTDAGHDKNQIDVKIKSDIPISSGLGSSASLCVALIKSLSDLMQVNIDDSEISKMAWEIERNVQGFASGIDPFVSTFGGVIYYRAGMFHRLPISALSGWNFSILNSGIESSTKAMVNRVARVKTRVPSVINSIFESIGAVSEEAQTAILVGDKDKVGLLMKINQGLLESLGVSMPRLFDMFVHCLGAGALGAKITGAGGGGCIICLWQNEPTIDKLNNICSDWMNVTVSPDGVRKEVNEVI